MYNCTILSWVCNATLTYDADIPQVESPCLPLYAHIHTFSSTIKMCLHDDVINWKHFPCHWPFVRGIHRSPVNSQHKGQWRGALMFSLIRSWISSCVNNREAGDLRRHRAHYDVSVMTNDKHTALWRYFRRKNTPIKNQVICYCNHNSGLPRTVASICLWLYLYLMIPRW